MTAPARWQVGTAAAQTFPIQRVDLVRYAGASGDFNPIHWNERFATSVGLPDVIAHGMFTMAAAIRVVTDWAGDPAAVVEYGVRFTRPVVVPDAARRPAARRGQGPRVRDDGRVQVDLTASFEGQTVLARARAVVRLPRRLTTGAPPAGATAALAAGARRGGPARRLHVRRLRLGPPRRPPWAQRPSPDGPGACPSATPPPTRTDRWSSLTFTVADDLSTVTGTEHIVFTPDLPITELVFRLTANTAPTVAAGQPDHASPPPRPTTARGARRTPGRAPPATQGGLLLIPLGRPVPAGTAVSADLEFTLTLGGDSFDRFGRVRDGADYAWCATAQPLLAWERGVGWHTEDLIQFTAESATSEAAAHRPHRHRAGADTVHHVRRPGAPPRARRGTRRLARARSPRPATSASRSGRSQLRDTTVGGVALRVGAPDTVTADDARAASSSGRSPAVQRFGPVPVPALSVARLPAGGGGIEYPGSILMLDGSRPVAVHEMAHQWFYAMVGNSQARTRGWTRRSPASPRSWSTATPPPRRRLTLPGRGRRSTDLRRRRSAYYSTTYDKGAAALLAARAAAGADAFDAALRCYVNANAWRIATPATSAPRWPAARASRCCQGRRPALSDIPR